MYIYTIWNKNEIPLVYQNYLDRLKFYFPSLELIRMDNSDSPRIDSDIKRLEIAMEINEDTLYIDSDCELISPNKFNNKISWYNMNGHLTSCILYKPKGFEPIIKIIYNRVIDLYKNGKDFSKGSVETIINKVPFCNQFGYINNYKHYNLGYGGTN